MGPPRIVRARRAAAAPSYLPPRDTTGIVVILMYDDAGGLNTGHLLAARGVTPQSSLPPATGGAAGPDDPFCYLSSTSVSRTLSR
jgi:hypothetical protein